MGQGASSRSVDVALLLRKCVFANCAGAGFCMFAGRRQGMGPIISAKCPIPVILVSDGVVARLTKLVGFLIPAPCGYLGVFVVADFLQPSPFGTREQHSITPEPAVHFLSGRRLTLSWCFVHQLTY